MKRIVALSLIAALALATVPMAQEGDDMQKMQEAWMAAGTPGEHHGHLAKLAGEWTYTAKSWQQPGAEPMEWTGNRSAKMIMDGRYLQETVDGSFMGMPFKGMALYAYDNTAEQYVATWVDNMSTSMTTATGTCSKEGWAFQGTHLVPGMNVENAYKETIRWVDDDTFVFEWHEAMPGQGDMFKMMEITYKRKK
jgi:hypothetical protein